MHVFVVMLRCSESLLLEFVMLCKTKGRHHIEEQIWVIHLQHSADKLKLQGLPCRASVHSDVSHSICQRMCAAARSNAAPPHLQQPTNALVTCSSPFCYTSQMRTFPVVMKDFMFHSTLSSVGFCIILAGKQRMGVLRRPTTPLPGVAVAEPICWLRHEWALNAS